MAQPPRSRRTVAGVHGHVCKSKPREPFVRRGRKIPVAFHRINHRRKPRKNRGRVPRTRADLQYFFMPLQFHRFDHGRHDEGLRNGLPFADGNGLVLIGLPAKFFGNEFMPWDFEHRIQHSRIPNASLAQLPLNHFPPLCREIRLRRLVWMQHVHALAPPGQVHRRGRAPIPRNNSATAASSCESCEP